METLATTARRQAFRLPSWASKRCSLLSQTPRARPHSATRLLRPTPSSPRKPLQPHPTTHLLSKRHNSSITAPNSPSTSEPPEDLRPAYLLTFTCKPCGTRSSHRVTKQGYHNGTVLITCPSCHNRHVITDHLKVFMDQALSFEDILQKKLPSGRPLSDLLKKGKLGIRQGSMVGNEGEEDVEFWEDGTETQHEKKAES